MPSQTAHTVISPSYPETVVALDFLPLAVDGRVVAPEAADTAVLGLENTEYTLCEASWGISMDGIGVSVETSAGWLSLPPNAHGVPRDATVPEK